MAASRNFPVYYGNTDPGGQIYVPGNPNNSTPNGAFGPFGPGLNNDLANPFNVFGSSFNGFWDPLNLANNYAITPLTPPPAPQFTPGTMPTQNFTNNNFGDFNTPNMQATANGAHPSILMQPPPPPPKTPPSSYTPVAGTPLPAAPPSVQAQQSTAAQNVVDNSKISGLNPQTISNDYLFSKGNTPQDQLLSGGTPNHIAAYLKSVYGKTQNTAISRGSMSVPLSYNTVAAGVR